MQAEAQFRYVINSLLIVYWRSIANDLSIYGVLVFWKIERKPIKQYWIVKNVLSGVSCDLL